MKILLRKLLCLCLLITSVYTYAQQPFYDDIQAFKKQDSLRMPPPDEILFVGSSSFTKWTDVQNYFPNYPIINRGFGGSSLTDVIYYFNDIIIPYHPKQIVIYCGENDLAASDTVSAQIVFQRFKTLFSLIRNEFPNEPVVFISIKPSPSRARLMPKIEETNKLIKAFLSAQKNAGFVDVYHSMLTKQYKPIPDIFTGDSLHMNARGYAIWKKAIEPHLLK
jgi:lysophospholipase L1-like esterase